MKKWLSIFKLSRKEFIALIAAISILKCLLIYIFLQSTLKTPGGIYFGYVPDSMYFETLAKNIISGHGFSLSSKAPFIPSMFKEPLYPFVIGLIYSIFGSFFGYVVLLQVFLSPFIAILVYLIGREVFNERIARFSSFLVCLTPIFGEISFFIQTEGFCIPIFLLSVYLIIKAFKEGRLSYYFFSAAVLGISTLCRAMLLYAPALIMILIILGYGRNLKFDRQERPRRRVTKALIYAIGFLLVVLPWIARNAKEFNSLQIRFTGGQAIWTQAKMAESFTNRKVKGYLLYIISGRLAQKYFPDFIEDNLGEFEYRYIAETPIEELGGHGLSEGEIDTYLRKKGVGIILAHPFKYLRLSSILYLQVFKYFLPWAISCYNGRTPILSDIIFPAIRFLFGFPLSACFTLMTIIGIYISRKRLIRYLPLLVFIGYYHFILFFFNGGIGGVRRFILIVVPLFYFFVCLFIFKILKIQEDVAK